MFRSEFKTRKPARDSERELKQRLVHTARQMFESRIAKYNDPNNLEWDWDDITDKWERHAFSAYMDLRATEKERDRLIVLCRRALAIEDSVTQGQERELREDYVDELRAALANAGMTLRAT